ncbi:MAG: dephospho-CoA kinase [Chitinispirillia bacterium]|nr:dephospho-CoA kinase [Chitinispirillia bacterium]MCL2241245.1 dephospho-CoA kinase [Chitinispirillia bacterium]
MGMMVDTMADITRIGIAGYMGAGKTTCARLFEPYGAEIIDADAEAKAVMLGNTRLYDDLRSAFGASVIGSDGKPRFGILGPIVFRSAESLKTYNSIVHPPILKHLEQRVADCKKNLCILDAALIPLWASICGRDLRLDRYIWVDVPFNTRLTRLKAKRTDVDEQELIRRMRLQEEIMPVPVTAQWVRLPDTDCRGYIVNTLNK